MDALCHAANLSSGWSLGSCAEHCKGKRAAGRACCARVGEGKRRKTGLAPSHAQTAARVCVLLICVFMFVHVCLCLYMCVCVFMFVYSCLYICLCVCLCLYMCVYMCSCLYMFLQVCSCLHTCVSWVHVCSCLYPCIHVCRYVFMFVHVCLCVCTCMLCMFMFLQLCSCLYLCSYFYMCIHVFIYLYTCVHVCTCVSMFIHVCSYVCTCPCSPSSKTQGHFSCQTQRPAVSVFKRQRQVVPSCKMQMWEGSRDSSGLSLRAECCPAWCRALAVFTPVKPRERGV